MTKAKTPRHSNRRSSKCPGKHKTLAASDNAPAGKAACPGESILRAAHIPDGLLCVCGHAPTAGTLLASLRAHNISAGEGALERGGLCESPDRFPAQATRRGFRGG